MARELAQCSSRLAGRRRPRHNIDCIIDIKHHSASNNSAPDIDEFIVEADDLAQRLRILPARDGRLRAEVLADVGQATAGKL